MKKGIIALLGMIFFLACANFGYAQDKKDPDGRQALCAGLYELFFEQKISGTQNEAAKKIAVFIWENSHADFFNRYYRKGLKVSFPYLAINGLDGVCYIEVSYKGRKGTIILKSYNNSIRSAKFGPDYEKPIALLSR